MNANDHTTDNITQFGSCSSSTNPKLQMQIAIVGGIATAVGGGLLSSLSKAITGKSVTDVLQDIGIISCKCTPDTPNVWVCDETNHLLDGAPVLTMTSVLHCRNGGTIEMLPLDEYPPADAGEEAATSETEDTPEDVDTVADAAQQGFNDAMAKIDAAAPPDMADASGQASATAQMAAMAAMATLPASTAAMVMSALGVSTMLPNTPTPISATAQQRQENLSHNQALAMPEDALNAQGLIADPSKLEQYTILQYPASVAGGGAVAAYNTLKTMDSQASVSFPEVIHAMEPYGLLQMGDEFSSPGVADYLAKQGFGIQYMLPEELNLDSNVNADTLVPLSLSDSGAINYSSTGVATQITPLTLRVVRPQMED